MYVGDIPTTLAWGKGIVVAGPDCKNTHEFVIARFNPGGGTVVFGSYNGFHIFSESTQRGSWEDQGEIHVENLYSISTLEWKPDGSQLVLGGLCGNVDIYDACLRQYRYDGKFEFTYITKTQVIVRRLSTGSRTVLRSHHGEEITQINIYHDQYLIAHTPKTLLMGNLESCKLSEVPWCGSGNEKFLLDHPSVCMVHNAGELSLVEYGCNEVLGTCRTEHLSPYLISIRINEMSNAEASPPPQEEIKMIAYLLDLQTIRILDLVRGVTAGTLIHDLKIDWLELNPTATHLLFRDKKQQLHLFSIQSQERTTLLNFCSYVQWVPGRDVVVAQNQGNLYVWYSIKDPDQATFFPIKGEVEGIERSMTRTEVIVNEGINIVSLVLDEALIEFGSALDNLEFERAISILEPLQLTSETEAMWKQLSDTAFLHREYSIAENCYAALGDVAKARFMHKVNKTIQSVSRDTGTDGRDHYLVRAKLALLQHQWKVAEMLLLEHGHVAETIQMYTECHRWREAIAVAETQNHPDAESLKRNHFEWLLQTGQEEEAGHVKEAEGDMLGAISLFIKGGLPGHAAECVNNHSSFVFQNELIESIAAALHQAGMFEKLGDFLEKRGKDDRAKEAYRRGHAYRRAIELARRVLPSEVVWLEEEWGSWLVTQNQVDGAINHFIEAGCGTKAIEAAIASGQWTKAVQIVEAQSSKVAQPFYKRLARHFETAKQYMEAEKFYIRAKLATEAVEMYIRANRWEAGYKVASRYLSEAEGCALYLQRARELEASGSYKDAEKLFIDAKAPDHAINMYKKAHMFDDMIRLVTKHRPDLLTETHLHLAQQLESEGALREAEQQYLGAQDWKSTVKMYSVNTMWEDAMRVAKLSGGVNGPKHVAYAWAVSLGGEAGAQLLVRLGLVEQAIEYATEAGAFEHAFDLCRSSLKYKLPEVQLKYAMFLEDEGRFREAEEAFIKVGKPREAIDMYIHQLDWSSAMRVADLCDPAAVSDIQVAQTQEYVANKDYPKAEALLVRAKRPDLAVEMYKEKLMWEDAVRVAEKHAPSKISDIHAQLSAYLQSNYGDTETIEGILARARTLERSRNYIEAINTYLKLDTNLVPDIKELQQVWAISIKLAKEYEPARVADVVGVVTNRLKNAKCYDETGILYEDIGAAKEAAEMYILGGSWDKARKVARAANPQLQQEVENLYKNHLLEKGEADELVKTGNIPEALELYAQQLRWEQVHELSALLGTSTVKNFSVRHARHCLQENKCSEAISILAQYGIPDDGASYKTCIRAARQLFMSNESSTTLEKSYQSLRSILYQIASTPCQIKDADLTQVLVNVNKHLVIVHYIALAYTCKSQGLREIEAKIKVSLLRYAGLLPADRVFYEAGIACKQMGWQDMAFVLLNRYLDIIEAMDEENKRQTVVTDNAGFEASDIPHEFPLPQIHYLEGKKC
ncbi:hypothetical protein R1flu_020343 [Riccia fluitans]|uniref:IFT80/172/WDR35 TPR domain-containing protein n=1 Tax=Riccia fluitans TaxID=41844 RepID=A0ABD1ZL88_9MARC